MHLTWHPPVNTGGSPLKQYELIRDPSFATSVMIPVKLQEESYSYIDSSLNANQQYTYKVQVQNEVGLWSNPSDLVSATPLSPQPTPSIPPDPPEWIYDGAGPLTPGAGTIKGQWTSPKIHGSYPIKQFVMQVSKSEDFMSVVKSDTILTSISHNSTYTDTITGLEGPVKYYVRVKAESLDTHNNELLDSSWSTVWGIATSQLAHLRRYTGVASINGKQKYTP